MALYQCGNAGGVQYQLTVGSSGWHDYHYNFASFQATLVINGQTIILQGESGQVDDSQHAYVTNTTSGTI